MKAAVFHGQGDLRVEERPVPEPGPGEALLRIKYCGICGSDLEAYRYGLYEPGIVIGHEIAAEVAAVGPGVAGLAPGDRVTSNDIVPCGECRYCRTGRVSICDAVTMPGVTCDGGFAEYMTVAARALYRLPDGVSDLQAALTDPSSNALHAVNRSGLRLGDRVLVIGAGPIGLLIVQAALLAGARRVFVAEMNETRRCLAREMGASEVINPEVDNLDLAVADLTEDQGADVVFCASGSPGAMASTFTLVRKGGVVVPVGICEQPVAADFLSLVMNELDYRGTYASYDEYGLALDLMAQGRWRTEPLVSAVIPLEQIVAEGFEVLLQPGAAAAKILVRP
ncbi:MAG: galactitol-1-phosphate 5-dehydrogenase [Bacillota bacterium]|jgi:(R,R)-butanediol dehydrogenase/meso-butanediol dehydrogenase/diacetyl reductase